MVWCHYRHRYINIPELFSFNRQSRVWTWRTRQFRTIGRIYTVSPRDQERFYLRILLLNVPGPTSYEDLRTVDGQVYDTFREACLARGLTENDEEWERSLREAAQWQVPFQLRHLFAMLVVWCEVTDVVRLFHQFKELMSEDFVRELEGMAPEQAQVIGEGHAWAEINRLVLEHGHPGLMAVGVVGFEVPDAMQEAEHGGGGDVGGGAWGTVEELVEEQLRIFGEVMVAAQGLGEPRLFFVDGPGGTGKTYLYGVIVNSLRERGLSAICVAWTGIAAMLLPSGTTVHNRFRLPLDIRPNTPLGLRGQSEEARVVREASLLVWDEAPMAPAVALDVVDRGLRQLMEVPDEPFGGKAVLLGGDFRQVLPVVPRATRQDQVAASIRRSHVWPLFAQRRLTRNMRTGEGEAEFAGWLLDVGDGRLGPEVEIPEECRVYGNLVEAVFGDTIRNDDVEALRSRVVLTPTNADCRLLNADANAVLVGDETVYRSIDCMDLEEAERDMFPVEVLNTIELASVPPHELRLRVGSVVMLLRNLDINRGLCNGVRMVVRRLQSHVIEAEMVTGQFTGRRTFIPRIKNNVPATELGVEFRRRQFPLRLAFGMTINKAQGQTFERIGLYLMRPVFSHGQLYVALSRVRRRSSLLVKLPQGRTTTTNVVYREVLGEVEGQWDGGPGIGERAGGGVGAGGEWDGVRDFDGFLGVMSEDEDEGEEER